MDPQPLTWQQLSEALRLYAQHEWGVDVPAVTFHLSYLGDNRKSLALPPRHVPIPVAEREELPVSQASLEPPKEQFPWDPWHSETYEMVCWEGKKYEFGPTAKLVVKALWEAWEKNRPDIELATLRRLTGTQTAKIANLFAGNSAWNTLIIKGAGSSCYRLAMRCASDPVQNDAEEDGGTKE